MARLFYPVSLDVRRVKVRIIQVADCARKMDSCSLASRCLSAARMLTRAFRLRHLSRAALVHRLARRGGFAYSRLAALLNFKYRMSRPIPYARGSNLLVTVAIERSHC